MKVCALGFLVHQKRTLIYAAFNFSHYITELSFGPHYPSLLNPLDKTISTTPAHFHKFQYYLSIVPTIFTQRRVSTRSGSLDPAAIPQPPTLDLVPIKDKDGKEVSHVLNKLSKADSKTVFTNQYAATSQSRAVAENTVPGIFFKYDIEPILLIVAEQRSNFLALVVRLVNVVSGVLVGGGWLFQLSGWMGEMMGRKGRRSSGGVLHGRHATVEDDHDE
jgi:endoplasmic reticulum-Golgi intermediate compartment protein 2